MDDGPRTGWDATALDVHRRLRELRADDATAALATVVDVEGSAFRRPGAKMVLTPDGEQVGAITAGCLEDPVATLAEAVFDAGEPELATFDLMDDDGWGLGLGCNGVIDVYVDPVDASLDDALAALADGEGVALLTVLETDVDDVPSGARATIGADGTASDSDARAALPPAVAADLADVAAERVGDGATVVREVDHGGGTLRILVDGLAPPPKLLVFGGQPDTVPVVRLARQVGFEVTVATARGGLAEAERFPGAAEVLACNPSELATHVDERTHVVVMSHNLVDDELALSSLVDTEVPYVGLMGPRKRFAEIREDLQADGDGLPPGFLERISTPVGLDLGGGAPLEIALSIVGEVLAVTNDRAGGRLSEGEGPIHSRRPAQPED